MKTFTVYRLPFAAKSKAIRGCFRGQRLTVDDQRFARRLR